MQLIRRIALLFLLAPAASAGVLPDDRADLMYHYYDGGGITIDGPSLLVRKKFAEKYAVNASYYVDMVSSASIDVVTTASPYKEERTQYGVGFEYLRGKVTYAASFSNSSENDYDADTASLSISQDMFGDLTTVSLSFTRGWDDVTRRGDAIFADTVDRRIYGVNISQVATKNLILGLSYETITEEGFLNNPYRQVRFVDPDAALGYSYQAEVYPRTRTGNAVALRGRWYLPYRAAMQADYRFYTDTWDILGHTAEVSYTHPLDEEWTFDVHYRFYTQNAAEFYSDLFPARGLPEFPRPRQGTRLDAEPHARLRRRLRVQATGGPVIPEQGRAQPAVRPHQVRLRRLPRPDHDRVSARRGAALPVRRGRHPVLLLGLVLGIEGRAPSYSGGRSPLIRRRQPLRIEHTALCGHDDRIHVGL